MAGYTGNTCDIITLFPLGVICQSVNAYTPFTSDGAINLFITGGTPPYTITWNNGSQSQNITNLQSGNYTATIKDYYGDFTATTTCVVGYDTFYIEKFKNCTTLSEIYYNANLSLLYSGGSIYSLNNQQGCWISEGIELYTGQTYYNYSAVTVTGPFENCSECLPTAPVVLNTSAICLTNIYQSTVTQYQFFSGGTINGYPSWTSSTNNQVIYYNTTNTSWRVSGWTLNGTPYLQNATSPPIGTWDMLNSIPASIITVNQGSCGNVMTATISSTPPLCQGGTNGTITVTSVAGGTAPYTYSLIDDLSFYQSSPTFLNLSEGNYTVFIQDLFGNVTVNTVNLLSPTPPTQYTINLTLTPTNGTQLNFTTTNTTKLWNWSVSVTPPLPAGKELNFTLTHASNYSATTVGALTSSVSYSQTTGTTGGGQFLTSQTPIVITNNSSTVPCSSTLTYTNYLTNGTIRQYTAKIVGTGTVNGTVTQGVTITNNSNGCPVVASIIDSVSITNIQLVNQNQCEIINTNVQPLTFSLGRTGTQAASINNQQL
jgi:hypothetical protein